VGIPTLSTVTHTVSLCKLSKSITYQLNTHYFTSVKAVMIKRLFHYA
jgi:hypothetical protein